MRVGWEFAYISLCEYNSFVTRCSPCTVFGFPFHGKHLDNLERNGLPRDIFVMLIKLDTRSPADGSDICSL